MVRFPPGGRVLRCLTVVVATVVPIVMSGCGGGNSEDADTPRATLATAPETTTTTEPPEPEMTVEEEVEAAYHEANRALFTVLEDPTRSVEAIRASRGGESLEIILKAIEERRSSGARSTYPSGYLLGEVLETEVDGDVANLLTCEISDAIVALPDGTVLNDDVEVAIVQVTLRKDEGVWRVHQEIIDRQEPGSESCDE